MELTKIQKIAVDHVEMIAADTWKLILNLANDGETDVERFRALCCKVRIVREHINALSEELKCRIGIDLGPDTSHDMYGFARVYILNPDKPDDVFYNGCESMSVGSGADHELILRGLAQDFQFTLVDFLESVDKVNAAALETNIDDEVEKLLLQVTFMKAVNDFMSARFGEDDSGIVIYPAIEPVGVINVMCYQPDGMCINLKI